MALIATLLLALPGLGRAATITVDTTGDPGPAGTCDLRAAIANANNQNQSGSTNCAAGTGTDTINFSVSGAITLGSTLPAIANTSPGSLTIDGSGQTITVDGANSFQILTVNSGATLHLKFLTLFHGASDVGGAILNNGTLTVANGTFSDNQAVGGGAIENVSPFNGPPATLTVTNSTFSANVSRPVDGVVFAGGAILNVGSTVIITNSTFSDNQAFGGLGDFGVGGAIANLSNPDTFPTPTPGTLSVTNSTFSGNKAEVGGVNGGAIGGAIWNNSSTANLKGNILAASTGGNCGSLSTPPTPPVTDDGYNISDDTTCGFSATGSQNSTNPMLAGLANNGGPTQTIALLLGSPAIDAIPAADCTDQSSPPQPITTDQRGMPRPDAAEDVCDIGAYESQETFAGQPGKANCHGTSASALSNQFGTLPQPRLWGSPASRRCRTQFGRFAKDSGRPGSSAAAGATDPPPEHSW